MPDFPMKQPTQPPPPKLNLEILFEQFITQQMTTNKQTMDQFKQMESRIDQFATHNCMLETQITQQASFNSKASRKLPSQLKF